jgi:hypothetical protein
MEEQIKNEIQNNVSNIENTEKSTENKEDLEQLKKDKEDAEKKIDELEQVLKSIELDISNLQKQIPEVDGKYMNREYEHFTSGLGENFRKKLDVVLSIQRDMSNDFVNSNLEDKEKDNLSKSITAIQSLVDSLKRSETGDENYDNQQFIKLTRGAFDIIIGAYDNLKYIKKYNGYIDKYLEEKKGLNEYQNEIDNDPKNIEVKRQIYDLGQLSQEKLKEKQTIQIERNNIDSKIKEIEK